MSNAFTLPSLPDIETAMGSAGRSARHLAFLILLSQIEDEGRETGDLAHYHAHMDPYSARIRIWN